MSSSQLTSSYFSECLKPPTRYVFVAYRHIVLPSDWEIWHMCFWGKKMCLCIQNCFKTYCSIAQETCSILYMCPILESCSTQWLQFLIHLWLIGGLEHVSFFPLYWECHHPNWRTHIFQRVFSSTTNQLSILLGNHGVCCCFSSLISIVDHGEDPRYCTNNVSHRLKHWPSYVCQLSVRHFH